MILGMLFEDYYPEIKIFCHLQRELFYDRMYLSYTEDVYKYLNNDKIFVAYKNPK